MADAQLALEPTARNSKRLPVKAKGDVRLRSVLSSIRVGIWARLRSTPDFSLIEMSSSLSELEILSRIAAICEPVNTDMIAGGASLAPRRCPLVADIIEAFSRAL